jgi:hypothetical protein
MPEYTCVLLNPVTDFDETKHSLRHLILRRFSPGVVDLKEHVNKTFKDLHRDSHFRAVCLLPLHAVVTIPTLSGTPA